MGRLFEIQAASDRGECSVKRFEGAAGGAPRRWKGLVLNDIDDKVGEYEHGEGLLEPSRFNHRKDRLLEGRTACHP
jgi:hypothetical protein